MQRKKAEPMQETSTARKAEVSLQKELSQEEEREIFVEGCRGVKRRRRRPQILFGRMENARRMPRGVATRRFHPATFCISLIAREPTDSNGFPAHKSYSYEVTARRWHRLPSKILLKGDTFLTKLTTKREEESWQSFSTILIGFQRFEFKI